MKYTALILLLSAWGFSCAQNSAIEAPDHAAAEPEIYAAVFSYQFDHNASGIQKRAEKYCLELPGETSPDAAFLHRFDGHRPPVLSAGRCERRSGTSLYFRITRLDWIKDNEVWARGGYWEGNLSSSIESYRVLFKDGKWTVEGSRMMSVS
ncbi:MAG TPA: hypothetical protein VF173_33140 [Thermoanaerobaculia bacterium]|nr:hypothetical protein [Thermoanaerobaculia bacterium]